MKITLKLEKKMPTKKTETKSVYDYFIDSVVTINGIYTGVLGKVEGDVAHIIYTNDTIHYFCDGKGPGAKLEITDTKEALIKWTSIVLVENQTAWKTAFGGESVIGRKIGNEWKWFKTKKVKREIEEMGLEAL